MKIFVIGAGGREHALIWKMRQSPLVSKLYCAPGNPGIATLATCVALADTNIPALVGFAREKMIDLVVIGPEAPLAAGLANALCDAGIACFGPTKEAAQLESSKGYVKDLCAAYDIPTARYGRFNEASAATAFLDSLSPPYVIKADGLAAGKGVVIAHTRHDAEQAISAFLQGQFGAASAEIVIEEFLHGVEVSFFVLCDGETLLPLVAAQDHKRAFDGDKGPNTGGMGAYSPTPVFTEDVYQKTMTRILEPTVRAMKERGVPYQGVLYAGLMITAQGPMLIEYNARFGDPECQVLMRRLESDLVPVLMAAATGSLQNHALTWSAQGAGLVVYATNGYPGPYAKGSVISGLADAEGEPDVIVFHAGTKQLATGTLCANGGRVLNVTATGPTAQKAIAQAYRGITHIQWPEGYFRKDIGWQLSKQG